MEKQNIITDKGPVVIEKKFSWKEFFHVEWKDKWNIILLIAALIILYFSIRAIIHSLAN